MSRRKLSWIRTTIPERTKIKLWRLMIGNTTYPGWYTAIDAELNKYKEWEDTASRNHIENYSVFDRFDIKFVASSREIYNLLYEEIMLMPLDFVIKLLPDLQSWVSQLRPELKLEKYPRRKVEVTEMTTLPEKYLIDHYQKLHKVLEQFYNQFRTPELSELCLFTLKDRITISHSYVSEMCMPAITYEKGAVKFDVEDSFLWEYLKKHLAAEFPKFDTDLSSCKRGLATIVEGCHNLTKTIADKFTERGTKMRWDSAKPYLSPDSKDYGPGVYYDMLASSIYESVMVNQVPQFRRGYDSRELVMEYPGGGQAVARGGDSLLDQVEQCCLDIVDNETIKEEVKHLNLAEKDLESLQESIKQDLRLVLERGNFKGTCRICSDLVAKSD